MLSRSALCFITLVTFLMILTIISVFFSSVSSLGQSVEFRTIWALEISNKPGEAEPSEPKIRFVAGIHGNAPVGTELLLEFAAFLCINYGKNPNITRVSFRAPSGNIVFGSLDYTVYCMCPLCSTSLNFNLPQK